MVHFAVVTSAAECSGEVFFVLDLTAATEGIYGRRTVRRCCAVPLVIDVPANCWQPDRSRTVRSPPPAPISFPLISFLSLFCF